MELALFYLMVFTYFCMFWIWPSKHLLSAIDELEPRNFLPWILSAMVHTIIIYGLYGLYGALDVHDPTGSQYLGPILISVLLVFLPQIIVWVAWVEVTREKQRLERERAADSLLSDPGGADDVEAGFAVPEEGLGVSRIPAGCDEPPPPYGDVVGESPGPPPPYSEVDLLKSGPDM